MWNEKEITAVWIDREVTVSPSEMNPRYLRGRGQKRPKAVGGNMEEVRAIFAMLAKTTKIGQKNGVV